MENKKSPHLFVCRLGDSLPTLSVRDIWRGMPQAGVRWCGVFQVVKTAQSRGRTERTLFNMLISALHRRPGRGA